MDFCAKEITHLKYPIGLANWFIGLGATEDCQEKAVDEWPREQLEGRNERSITFRMSE